MGNRLTMFDLFIYGSGEKWKITVSCVFFIELQILIS